MTGFLLLHLGQSTLFALAAAAVVLALRRYRARLRYAIWLAASLKFLIPFALLTRLGDWLRPAPAPAPVAWLPMAAVRANQALFAAPAWVAAPTPAAPGPMDWARALAPFGLVLWVLGALAVAGWRLQGWRRARALCRGSRPAALPVACWPAQIAARWSPRLVEPGVVGCWRPTLLLPAGLADHLDPRQMQAVLAHELCHIRRRDNLAAAAHMLVEALFWFHPAVWWIGARLLAERERACDEAVLRAGNDPRVYAEGIVNVCRMFVASAPGWIAGVASSGLKQRITAIVAPGGARSLAGLPRLALAGAGLAVLLGPLAAGAMHQAQLASPSFDAASVREWTNDHGPTPPVRAGMQFGKNIQG